ncbi:UNVERIFIED_CONTAM: hypothetical protein HDU68_000061 [Siphonaria sp. JEL0065]|nr:hypothetical protein HDU68_000061 [Siphonaria sp. JEL0065]
MKLIGPTAFGFLCVLAVSLSTVFPRLSEGVAWGIVREYAVTIHHQVEHIFDALRTMAQVSSRNSKLVSKATVVRFQSYARYSFLAYTPKNEIYSWNCTLCTQLSSVDTISSKDTHVIIAKENTIFSHQSVVIVSQTRKEILISICGSKSTGDWINNLDPINFSIGALAEDALHFATSFLHRGHQAVNHTGEDSQVHSGFLNEWNMLKPQLMPLLRNLTSSAKYSKYAVTFTGHSLGGAIALLGASEVVHEIPSLAHKTSVITFGQPRVGNRGFRNHVLGLGLKEISHVVNNGDPVPYFTPKAWGFRHVEHEYWVVKGLMFRCDDNNPANEGEDTDCMNSVFAPVWSHLHYLGVNSTSLS